MPNLLTALIWLAGWGQLSVLAASALVPLRLDWRHELARLPRLHRQLVWVYAGYVVLAIVSLGLVSLCAAAELANGSGLARAVCAYAAVFWGVRLLLQAVLDARPHLTAWWLRTGYRILTAWFALFTAVFAWAAVHPVG